MYTIGLTGGIGSGKSAAEQFFAELGIKVVDADQSARAVVEPGMPALSDIQQHFGDEVIQSDGSLDRTALRARVFNNDTERQWLESLLHPLIDQHTRSELNAAQSPYAIYSAPLLIESGGHHKVDRVLVVDVPESLQIERASQRDGAKTQDIEAIMAHQCSRQQRLDVADDVIDNSDSLEALKEKVLSLHQQYLALSSEKSAAAKHHE